MAGLFNIHGQGTTALRFVYDSFKRKSRRHSIFTKASNSPRGDYHTNVCDEWATVITTPLTALFPDALAFARSLKGFHMHGYGISCKLTELLLKDIVARDHSHIVDNQKHDRTSGGNEDRRGYTLSTQQREAGRTCNHVGARIGPNFGQLVVP